MEPVDGTGALAIIPNNATLYGKMAQVMKLVSRVPKNGTNKFHGYKYAMADDVADCIRDAMGESNLALFAEMGEPNQEVFEYEDSNGKKKQTIRTTIRFIFTFACGDTGATMSKSWVGQVDDNSDKAISKCATAAEKYFLMKTFIVSAGDEPDADSDKHREEAGRKVAPPANTNGNHTPEAPKTAGECLQDPDCRKRFAVLCKELRIEDDAPYLAGLGGIERYGEYPGTYDAMVAAMRVIHAGLLHTPDPEPTTEQVRQSLGNGGNRRIGEKPPESANGNGSPLGIGDARRIPTNAEIDAQARVIANGMAVHAGTPEDSDGRRILTEDDASMEYERALERNP